jgi:subtilisin family serine protease
LKKIVGIFVMVLLIGTAIPTIGMINEYQSTYYDDFGDNEYVPGEFIIKFKEQPISILSLNNLNEKYHVYSTEKVFKNAKDTIIEYIYKFKVPIDTDILSIINDYLILDNVVYAEPNYIYHLCSIPNDPGFVNQWALHNTGQSIPYAGEGTPDCDIDAPEAWDLEKGSNEIIITILDSGIDYTHPDLADNVWINQDEIPDNDIDDDNNVYIDDVYSYDFFNNDSDPLDDCGHGTACAGIAGAVTNNGIGIAGVAWNCKIMPVKSFDEMGYGPNDKIANGIIYASDNGANIISMSFVDYTPSDLMNDSLEYAYSKNIVLVAAAGNDDKSSKTYPACCENVIAVAGTDHFDKRLYNVNQPPWKTISNYGFWVDVAAPGEWVHTTMPMYHVAMNDYGWDMNYTFGGTGTSFSTAIVAGLASLILSNNPSYDPDKVRNIIRANVDPYDSEVYIGTGRVNAHKVLMELNTQPEIPEAPSGETNGKPGREYSFTTIATDEDDDELWYFWDWGDGNYSEWLGPYASGEECEASYTWQQEANFSIKVKVKDGKGGESYWSEEFIFSTPKNKIIDNVLFERLFN